MKSTTVRVAKWESAKATAATTTGASTTGEGSVLALVEAPLVFGAGSDANLASAAAGTTEEIALDDFDECPQGACSPVPFCSTSAESELLHRERQIDALRRMSRVLTCITTADHVYTETLNIAIDVLQAEVGSVQIYDEASESLIFRYVKDPSAPHLLGFSVPISNGIDGRVFRTGIADLTNKVTERNEWNRIVDKRTGHRTDSMLTAPLKHPRGDLLGVVQILNGRRVFDMRDLEVLEVICTQASAAIANSQLHEEASRSMSHLQALHNIDLAITSSLDLRVTLNIFIEQLVAQLKISAASVLLFNKHTQTLDYAAGRGFKSRALQYTQLRLGESYAGQAALDRCMISIPNLADRAGELMRSPYFKAEGFVTYHAMPLMVKGEVKGVLETFHRTPFAPDHEWTKFLETLAGQAAIAIDNAEMFSDLQRSNVELALAYDKTLEGWSSALDLRDHETEGHTQRVTAMTLRLARALGLPDSDLVHLRRGALLHDIGKMGIPDSILLKPGPLTDEEWVVMKKHPVYAHELLSPIPHLCPALAIPYCHHEKWDGSGYPRGLKGEQIPLAARIFAVVDVWDALRSDRPYRRGWDEEKVREHIAQGSGQHFDPLVVEAFQKLAY